MTDVQREIYMFLLCCGREDFALAYRAECEKKIMAEQAENKEETK